MILDYVYISKNHKKNLTPKIDVCRFGVTSRRGLPAGKQLNHERRRKMARKKKTAKKKRAKGVWTTREVNLLKKLFPVNPTSKIASKFGRKIDAVKKKAARLGLRKAKRYLKSIGRT